MKRRTKRFDEGGDVVKDIAADANDAIQARANRGTPAKSESYKAEPGQQSTGLKRESFSDAFARARRAGDSTFEFGGKKYTTELKGKKSSGPDESAAETARLTRAAAVRPAAEPGLESVSPETMLPVGRGLKLAQMGAKALVGAGERRAAQAAAEAAKGAAKRAALKEEATAGTRAGRLAAERERDIAGWEGEGGRAMRKGGKVKKMASGGMTSSASKRADGCAQRGKTRGKMY